MKNYSIILIKIITILSISVLCAENTDNQGKGSVSYVYSNLLFNRNLKTNEFDSYGNGIYSLLRLEISDFMVINEMFITYDSLSASKGVNKSVKGLFGFSNRAIITYNTSYHDLISSLSFGRDYYHFGVRKYSALFVSKESRPFDQFRWEYKYKIAEGGLTVIQLDNAGDVRRYLTIHTLKLVLPWGINAFWGESILYTGKNRAVEFQYFNPVILWTPELIVNSTGDANGFIYGGLELNYFPNWQIWGELLVDDYQVNKEVKGDLEPNEIGLVAGIQKSGWPFSTSLSWLEYTKITNRTYQTPKPEEAYTHRGYPIGHYLGNDFDLLQMHYEHTLAKILAVSYFKPSKMKFYFDIGYLRDGANGIDTPFDTPWENSSVTIETGYSEPFPTGPITYYTEIETGVDFHFDNDSYMNTGLVWQRKGFRGEVDYNYSLVVRLSLTLSKKFNY